MDLDTTGVTPAEADLSRISHSDSSPSPSLALSGKMDLDTTGVTTAEADLSRISHSDSSPSTSLTICGIWQDGSEQHWCYNCESLLVKNRSLHLWNHLRNLARWIWTALVLQLRKLTCQESLTLTPLHLHL